LRSDIVSAALFDDIPELSAGDIAKLALCERLLNDEVAS
jgi:hypothetical protein